jgi:hypothetical protein
MALSELAKILSPFLPTLVSTEEVATNPEQMAFPPLNKADELPIKAIWNQLHPAMQGREDLQTALRHVVAKPDSLPRQAVLQEELDILFRDNPVLADSIAQIVARYGVHTRGETKIIQQVTGSHAQGIGQVMGGIVIGPTSGRSEPPSTPSVPNAPLAAAKTILFLAANPRNSSQLRLGEEVREIQAGLDRAQQPQHFVLQQRWAVTVKQLRRALLDCQPTIVHFSGHGVGTEGSLEQPEPFARDVSGSPEAAVPEGLVFETEQGQSHLVSGQALADLFALFEDHIECVVLNACYSAQQAADIVQHIPYVVGMTRAIGDRAAIEFAIGFYDALLAGKSVEFAFQLGCNALQLEGIPEHLTPVLKCKSS